MALNNLFYWLLPTGTDVAAQREAIEAFISTVLVDAGLWQGRTSDGVRAYRVVGEAHDLAGICGELWTIDQVLHVFWLKLLATERPEVVEWVLYYELQAAPRRLRHAVYLLESPDNDTWSVILSGEGTAQCPGAHRESR